MYAYNYHAPSGLTPKSSPVVEVTKVKRAKILSRNLLIDIREK